MSTFGETGKALLPLLLQAAWQPADYLAIYTDHGQAPWKQPAYATRVGHGRIDHSDAAETPYDPQLFAGQAQDC